MLDIKYLRSNPEEAKQRLFDRGITGNELETLLKDDSKRRDIIQEVEVLKAQRNQVTEKIASSKRNGDHEAAESAIAEMQKVGDQIKVLDEKLSEIDNQVSSQIAHLPNLAHSDVPVGADEEQNVEVSTWEPKDYSDRLKKTDVKPDWLKAHYEIGEELGILDFERGAKAAGARFLYYVGAGARLERALYNFMLDEHRKEGYTEILPPYLVTYESMYASGQYPKFEDDAYQTKADNLSLIPTAEVALINWRRDEVIDAAELPLSVTALTPAFRQEAGAAGKDTRGLIRLHQFNKVEMVKFTKAEQSYDELEKMRLNAENILQKLELPFHTILLSTGDMGFGASKTYDLEVWLPQQERYREISSISNDEDFQGRRAHIQYRDENGKLQFAHTLNGSGLAVGRAVAAILENYQNQDGSITIPTALVPYFGDTKITKENAK